MLKRGYIYRRTQAPQEMGEVIIEIEPSIQGFIEVAESKATEVENKDPRYLYSLVYDARKYVKYLEEGIVTEVENNFRKVFTNLPEIKPIGFIKTEIYWDRDFYSEEEKNFILKCKESKGETYEIKYY